jgi:FtsP/CotA-like multicopper oxidase with cupredoxin domain
MKVFILSITASVVLILICALIYNTLSQKGIFDAKEYAPENFVGGLRELPAGELATLRPSEVVELKDGDTFELVASIVKEEVGNRTIKRLAYNGQIPGPMLKVEKGAHITINFKNNIDMATALHSHGVRGDWKFDGAVPVSQEPIPVGGTYTYELTFPDTGIFWYHPHVREDYQQDLGLYGNMLVTEEGYWSNADQEEFLILDDVAENTDYDKDLVTHALMGRYGDKVLVNDQDDYKLTLKQGEITRFFVTNVASVRTFDITFDGSQTKVVGGDNGRIEKEYATKNTYIAPSERYIFEVIYEHPGTYPILNRGVQIGEVTVEAQEGSRLSEFTSLRSNEGDYGTIRADMVSLLREEPDKRLRLDIALKDMTQNDAGIGEDGKVTLMGVVMTKEQAIEHCGVMPQMKECGPLLELGETEIVSFEDKQMTKAQARQRCELTPTIAGCDQYLTRGTPAQNMHAHIDGIEWEDGMLEINGASSNETVEWIIEDEDTKKQNDAIDWSFTQGEMVKVRVFNDGKGLHPMQHPLHFHGQRFLVLGRDGVANENLQWKDTVLIPMGVTVDLLVDMSNKGTWMAHCHIAEHMQSGMMFNFKVE